MKLGRTSFVCKFSNPKLFPYFLLQNSTSSSLESWRQLLSSKKREGYGAIKNVTISDHIVKKSNSSFDVIAQNNTSPTRQRDQKKSLENNSALEQIQNALFEPKKSPLSSPENESANSKEAAAATITSSPSLAKSRSASSSPAVPSCQRIRRCKKLVKRIRKVFGETLKFSNEPREVEETGDQVREEEDIYVEVRTILLIVHPLTHSCLFECA